MQHEIDLGSEVIINVKMGDKVYALREPTLDDIESMSNVDSGDTKAANKMLQDFVIGLGMPEDVVKSLGIIRLKKLSEGLTNSFSDTGKK